MSTSVYLISICLIFGTILAIFGMRYWSIVAASRTQQDTQDAYRKLAADAVTAQSGNAATLSAIQSELAEIKTRMANVEKILKEVE
jgi:Tfp pilus assembly protein PilO